MQDYTLHTHTVGFDGRNTAQEMIASAQERGFRAIGISNHFIVHPGIRNAKMYQFAMRGGYNTIYAASFDECMARFRPHYDELRRLGADANIRVLCGMEVDYFHNEQWRRGFDAAVRELKPDYLIGSGHFVDLGGELLNVHDLVNMRRDIGMDITNLYWAGVKNAAASGLFTWMAHLNLPHKVGLGDEDMWTPYEADALDAMVQTGTAMEINTRASDGVYPSDRILKMAAEREIPVLISDDSHFAPDLGAKFEMATEKIAKFGLRHLSLEQVLALHLKKQ